MTPARATSAAAPIEQITAKSRAFRIGPHRRLGLVASVPRWVLAVVGVVVLVAAADIGAVIVARGGHDAAADTGGVVAVVDPDGARVVARVGVGAQPTLIATGFGGAWVLNKGEGTVTHWMRIPQQVVSTLEPDAVSTHCRSARAASGSPGRARGQSAPLEEAKLERIDPATDAVDRTFDTHTGASVVAPTPRRSGRPGISAAMSAARRARMRPTARSSASSWDLRRSVAAGDNAVYYVGSLGSRVVRVSTQTGKETNEMTLVTDASLAAGNVPANPTGVAVGGGSVWISESDGNVLRVDQKLGGISARIPVCHNALAVAYGAGSVWTACGNGMIARVEPATDRVSAVVARGTAAARDRRRRGRCLGDDRLMWRLRWRRWWSDRGLRELRVLAIEHWDPVNVYDDPANAGVYDAYLERVGRMLRRGKGSAEIARYWARSARRCSPAARTMMRIRSSPTA